MTETERLNLELDRLSDKLRDWVEVVQQTYKGRPAGIDPAQVKPNCLYVLDWQTESPDLDTITVDFVEAVNGDLVQMRGSFTDLATFASVVVAGPFSLEE